MIHQNEPLLPANILFCPQQAVSRKSRKEIQRTVNKIFRNDVLEFELLSNVFSNFLQQSDKVTIL